MKLSENDCQNLKNLVVDLIDELKDRSPYGIDRVEIDWKVDGTDDQLVVLPNIKMSFKLI
jgi:hypothetical protein